MMKDKIKEIIHSEEFKSYPELFTPSVLALSTLSKIKDVINLPLWKNEKYAKLLTPSLLTIKTDRIVANIELLEKYGIIDYSSNATNLIMRDLIQNEALINYMIDNNYDLVINGKLSSMLISPKNILKKKYNIDLDALVEDFKNRRRNVA